MKKLKLGQIWKSCDYRDSLEFTRYLAVIGFPNDLYVEVRNVHTKRKSVIAKYRMKPSSTGYKFVSDFLTPFHNSENLIGGW